MLHQLQNLCTPLRDIEGSTSTPPLILKVPQMEASGWRHTPTALPPEMNPGTHWVRGWVSSRAGVEVLEKKKNLLVLRGLEPGTVQPVP